MSVIFGKSLQEHYFGAAPARTSLSADAFQRGDRDNTRFFGRNEKAAGYIILPEVSYEAFDSASESGKKIGTYKVFNSFPVGDATLSRLQRAATSEIQIYPDRETADQLADYKNWTAQVEYENLARSYPIGLVQKQVLSSGSEQAVNLNTVQPKAKLG